MHTDKTEKEQAEIYFRIKSLIPPDQNDAWEWVDDASRYPASLDAISASAVLHNARYKHLTLNNSQNFVNPETNACTNGVKNMWMRAKKKIRTADRATAEHIPMHLAGVLEATTRRLRKVSSNMLQTERLRPSFQ